jgi:protein-S-isoprenylcysteine O-methyltransferase Ste14
MSIFEIMYWLAIVLEIVIRYPYRKTWKEGFKTDQRASRLETTLLGLLTVFMFFLPIIFSATNWLDFANYSLPAWMGWLGCLLMIGALFVFWRAHTDLKSNWSPTLEIRQDHTLVTSGIYAYIRHPMYASQWLWVFAQIMLLQNWLAGPLNLLFFIPFYILRVRAEEKMMLDAFGETYREYMQKTGSVLPKSI